MKTDVLLPIPEWRENIPLDAVKGWLVHYLSSGEYSIDEPIGDTMSFDYIGLDSMARVTLMADMQGHFGVELSPTGAYDYVTVGALSEYVWSVINGVEVDDKRLLSI